MSYLASSGQRVYFCDADVRPTGTGFIDPFLRVEHDGVHGNPSDDTPSSYGSGWNTDARHQDGVDGFNDFDHSWTSGLPVSHVALNNAAPDGSDGAFARFRVDINQAANMGGDLLSLNQMLLYNCPDVAGDGSEYVSLAACSGGNAFFNLFGNTGDFINFDYRLHTGSGSGDVDVYVENIGFSGPYIALLDGWGCGDGSAAISAAYSCSTPGIQADNDGFQEWWTTGSTPETPAVPEPASLILLGSGLSAMGAAARRRRAQKSGQKK
jgi:hypothetical protein